MLYVITHTTDRVAHKELMLYVITHTTCSVLKQLRDSGIDFYPSIP